MKISPKVRNREFLTQFSFEFVFWKTRISIEKGLFGECGNDPFSRGKTTKKPTLDDWKIITCLIVSRSKMRYCNFEFTWICGMEAISKKLKDFLVFQTSWLSVFLFVAQIMQVETSFWIDQYSARKLYCIYFFDFY